MEKLNKMNKIRSEIVKLSKKMDNEISNPKVSKLVYKTDDHMLKMDKFEDDEKSDKEDNEKRKKEIFELCSHGIVKRKPSYRSIISLIIVYVIFIGIILMFLNIIRDIQDGLNIVERIFLNIKNIKK